MAVRVRTKKEDGIERSARIVILTVYRCFHEVPHGWDGPSAELFRRLVVCSDDIGAEKFATARMCLKENF